MVVARLAAAMKVDAVILRHAEFIGLAFAHQDGCGPLVDGILRDEPFQEGVGIFIILARRRREEFHAVLDGKLRHGVLRGDGGERLEEFGHGAAVLAAGAAFTGGDGILEQAVEIGGRDKTVLDLFPAEQHRAHAAILEGVIGAVGPVDLELVAAGALGGAIGLGAGDQRDLYLAGMDAGGHFVDQGLRALAADGFVDQAGRPGAHVAGERAGQVGIVAVGMVSGADGILEDADDRDRVHGRSDIGGAGIGEGGP